MDGRPDDPAAEHAVCTVTGWDPPTRLALDGWHAHLDLLVALAEGRPLPRCEEAFAAARTLVG